MINTLTKLQRMGISYLLHSYAHTHVNNLHDGGIIRFEQNYVGNFTTMYVYLKDDRFPTFELSLDINEEINPRVEYEFDYDSLLDLYRIYEKGEHA